jgi:predicted ATPase
VEALKQLFLRESQRQPVLLVFEDLHWVDPESEVVFDALVESLPTSRLLCLTTYRPEYQDRWGAKTYYSRLRLDPLPAEDTAELLNTLLGDAPALGALKTLLKERTDGNPFFVEECVRALAETGALQGQLGAYQLERDLRALQVPATVQALLAARIDRLPGEEKRLLQTVAVIGMDVPLDLLQQTVELTEEELRPALADLHRAEFLYEARLFPDTEYTFKHALTRDVAYGTLLQERRRSLHQRVGEQLEQRHAGDLSQFAEPLAGHFEQAEVWSTAARYWLMTAEKAKEHYNYTGGVQPWTCSTKGRTSRPCGSEALCSWATCGASWATSTGPTRATTGASRSRWIQRSGDASPTCGTSRTA